jgi:hypothetical protein
MVTKRLMKSLLAASAVALCASGAHAAQFTLNLTASGGLLSSFDSGGEHFDRYDVSPTGFPALAPLSVQVGDEIILNMTITDGPITLPSAADVSVFSFYLTGDGFPAGDSETHGDLSVFNGATMVLQELGGGTTTSGGVASNGAFFGPLGPTTFDSVTTDFFIDQINGSTAHGTFGTIDRGFFSADARNPSAVPEPAAWALMLVGFGGLGALLRRRRAAAVLA